MKLLIADRDVNERTGLAWVVRSYPIPFSSVDTAENYEELLDKWVRELPAVVCVELDMISRDQWEVFRRLVRTYRCQVIGITAEATFERALQAIELHAEDLWVKPVSPDRIKRTLLEIGRERNDPSPTVEPSSLPPLSYRSLFLDEEGETAPLLLFQPESERSVSRLHQFLEDAPFSEPPRLFPLSDTVAAVFPGIKPEKEKMETFRREGYRLIREWWDRYREALFLVIQPQQSSAPSLYRQYQLAREALSLRFYRGDQPIWIAEEPVRWNWIDPFLTPEEQRMWVHMLDQGDREGIRKWMRQEFSGLYPPYPEPGLLRIRLTSLLAQLRRYMKTWSLTENPDLEKAYHRIFSTILYAPLLDRILQELLLFVHALMEGAQQQTLHQNIDPVERGIQYIEREFHRPDLGLEEVAREVGRNPSYFSHLLSRQQGISFRQLLQSVRMKHARHLLATTNLSIREIASRCGYLQSHTFSRTFRRNCGCSPREYRLQKNRQQIN
ncbi:MAG: helix-turn-helix domain-containing protein [Firmicutes bacterium]|nr:helix-turn-helix domain-containing protein [Bacillota bacterium]